MMNFKPTLGDGILSINGQEIGTVESVDVAIDTPVVEGKIEIFPILECVELTEEEVINIIEKSNSQLPFYPSFAYNYKSVYPLLNFYPKLTIEPSPIKSYEKNPYDKPLPLLVETNPLPLVKESHFPITYILDPEPKIKKVKPGRLQKKEQSVIVIRHKAKLKLKKFFPRYHKKNGKLRNRYLSNKHINKGAKWWIDKDLKKIISINKKIRLQLVCDGCFQKKELTVKRTCEECGSELNHCKECGEGKGNICYYCGIKHLDRGEE